MKVCAGCSHEYEESFKFCPECGRAFGGTEAVELKQKMDQHLLDMKRVAGQEARLAQRAASGGLGDANIGPVFGHTNGEWGNA